MIKTHEKSEIRFASKYSDAEAITKGKVVIQLEIIQAIEGYSRIYILECVKKEDYDLTTLEAQLIEKDNIIKDLSEIVDIKNNQINTLGSELQRAREREEGRCVENGTKTGF